MKTFTHVKRFAATGVVALVAAIALASVPVQARSEHPNTPVQRCPPGTNVPQYCQSLLAQVNGIEKSKDAILKSYNEIVASTKRLEAKVNSSTIRAAIDAFLAQASHQADEAVALEAEADKLKSSNLPKALNLVATARVRAARARSIVASARVVAARALINHQ